MSDTLILSRVIPARDDCTLQRAGDRISDTRPPSSAPLRISPLATSRNIVFESVSLARSGAALFDDFSARFEEPRIGLIGDNGAGKSSLLRLACGLLTPDRGAISVHGLDTRRDRKRFPGIVGMMFQNPDDQIIFPTVLEELAFSLTALGEARRAARERARAFLAAHGLDAWAERAVGSLSQGQRQRLCLLSLDIAQPRLLLLDEPFASLDLPSQAALMRQIHASDRQILLATHVLDQVSDFERVLWLDRGRIRADGPGRAVCDAYRRDVLSRDRDAQLLS